MLYAKPSSVAFILSARNGDWASVDVRFGDWASVDDGFGDWASADVRLGDWILIVMDMCKARTLRLKALNKHNMTHTLYIEMENVTSKLLKC